MRKSDLAEMLAKEIELPKTKATLAVDIVIEAITDSLRRNEDVTLTGFGAFRRRHRSARTGKNPQTGASINIPASETVSFKPGKTLKESVNL